MGILAVTGFNWAAFGSCLVLCLHHIVSFVETAK